MPLGLLALSLAAGVLAPGRPVPLLNYRDAAGATRHLPNGTAVIVSFWASWCGPCREELPRLQRAVTGGQVRVLALNFGETVNTAKAYLNREGLNRLPVGFVSPADPGLWPLPGLPSSLLIDRTGTVRRLQYGPLSEARLNEWIRWRLNQP